MARRALVTGIGGQDGSYLAELLIGKDYEVYGTVLNPPQGLPDAVRLVEIDLTDADAVATAIEQIQPNEVYHLASVSFVPASWEDPVGTATFAAASPAALLEGLRRRHPEGRFLNAASGEIFGVPEVVPQNEQTPVAPITPYGVGKAFAHFVTGAFRRHHRLHASSAILFNHESPRRSEHFLPRKVSRGVAAISLGLEKELRLGDLSARRDWGFAGDYVRAMWMMLQADEPDDYVVATGEAHTVEELVAAAFDHVGLDWREHVRFDEEYARGASDAPALVGDPSKIRGQLAWEPEVGYGELVRMLVDADVEELRAQTTAEAR
jgi:GDPmannose 4,6-dehydratase